MHKLFPSFRIALLLLAYSIVFITCQKEYSYEGGISNGATGTAVYTLKGAGGTCNGSILTGKYYAGAPLTSGNTVQLEVNVTTAGSYSISTNTTNGVSFSTSGTFTQTGDQTITLTSNGTPAAEGSFNFTTPVGAGCNFTLVVEKAPAAMASFTLAGAPNACENALVYGTYVSGKALATTNNIAINVNVTAMGAYTLSTDTLDGISFSNSGTFTKVGQQKITLTGSGTPKFARNLVFTPLADSSSCTFPITVVNPDPLATYVLESGYGSPNPCIYTVSGTYASNTPLSNADSVSMHVYVTTIGNYTIATNTVNGMSFSYTGNFTKTGGQYVLLTGSGTPLTPGAYTFIPEIVGPHPLGGETCAFEITVQ